MEKLRIFNSFSKFERVFEGMKVSENEKINKIEEKFPIIIDKNFILQHKYIISMKITKKELNTEKIKRIVRIEHNTHPC